MHTTRIKGFTLIELIVVIGIIAILAAIVIVAVNPARQFALARNTQRRSDVQALLNGMHQYAADNNGSITNINLSTCPTTEQTNGNFYGAAGNAALSTLMLPNYLSAVPVDPQQGTSGTYTSCADANGRITIAAPAAEQGATISVTR